MRIAVIGAGNVGMTLGKRFAEVGHHVSFGVRDPKDPATTDLENVKAVSEAAADAEIIILAIPFAAAESALSECGDLRGKVVVDATNPLAMGPDGLGLTMGFETSGAEQIARFCGDGKLVKCFNQTGFGNMAEPRGSMMFICGDDQDANENVRKLAEDIGFDAITIGGISKARLLEPLAMLWIHLSFTSDLKRDFAFKIERH